MTTDGQNREYEVKALLQQYSQRQRDANQQVLQAIQQAADALRQAQQLLSADMQFHQTLSETGDYNQLKQVSQAAQQPQNDNQLSPWLLGRPPELQ